MKTDGTDSPVIKSCNYCKFKAGISCLGRMDGAGFCYNFDEWQPIDTPEPEKNCTNCADYRSLCNVEKCGTHYDLWQPITTPKPDPINHPPHYTFGKIEPLDVIEDWKLNYHLGNALKYIARAGRKDPNKKVEDLRKAVFYLEREIKNG